MSSRFALYCVVLSCFLAGVTEQKPSPPIIVNVKIENYNNNEQSATARATAAVSQQNTEMPFADFWDTTCALLRDHPWVVASVVSCTAYVGCVASLYGIAYRCMHHCPWAHWRQDYTTEQLRSDLSEAIALDLFKSINIVYTHERARGDFLTPLVCFINALESEISWHRYFLTLHVWLHRTHIHPFFPQQQTTRLHITEQLERLVLLRDLLVNWLGSYTSGGVHDE